MPDPQRGKRESLFQPKIFSSFQNYGSGELLSDLKSAFLQGLLAIPVALAVSFGCGVPPEYGISAAIVGGLLISLFGGSRVQIGGPVAAFVVIAGPVIHKMGLAGLATTTVMAGILLILMGLTDLGKWLQIVPRSVIIGLSSGIAVLLIASQLPMALGFDLPVGSLGLVESLRSLVQHWQQPSVWAVLVALGTAFAYHWLPRVNPHIPGGLLALLAFSIINSQLADPLLTLGDHFDEIFPVFSANPGFLLNLETLRELFMPALGITLLAGLEALHSAAVADAQIGGRSHTGTELLAHGAANICSGLLCALPVSGGIRRTGLNVRLGARSPLAGILQVVVLLPLGLLLMQHVHHIPLAALAGLLIRLAWNLSDFHDFKMLLSAEKHDRLVLQVTFALTVIAGVGIALQASLVLSSLLFMTRMAQASAVRPMLAHAENRHQEYYDRPNSLSNQEIPESVDVFEIQGAFFFGAAGKFEREIRELHKGKRWLILRMNHVLVLDGTGIQVLRRLHDDAQKSGISLLLAELNSACTNALAASGHFAQILSEHSYGTLEDALGEIRKRESQE